MGAAPDFQRGDIARSVAEEGHGFVSKSGEDNFSLTARRKLMSALRVDYFDEQVFMSYVVRRAIGTLHRTAEACFRQAVVGVNAAVPIVSAG